MILPYTSIGKFDFGLKYMRMYAKIKWVGKRGKPTAQELNPGVQVGCVCTSSGFPDKAV